jgi:hypothetical protein
LFTRRRSKSWAPPLFPINPYAVQGGQVIARDRLHFKVTNVGRKAIVLDLIGGRQLPLKLEPGEMFSDCSTEVKPTDAQRVQYYAAWDSIGREYRAPKKQQRALFE